MPSISLTPRNPTPVDDEIRKYNDLVKEFTSSPPIYLDRQVSLVKQFLKLDHSKIPDCDFNIQTADGWTPLMTVSLYSKTYFKEKDVKMLLDAGADVNLQTMFGSTALIFAAQNSRNDSTEETVKMLLGAGADVNLQTTFGTTALMWASKNSRNDSTEETVKMLLGAGADVNLQNKNGKTAYDLADSDSVKTLLHDAMKPKTSVLSTISLGDWVKGTTFRVVLERLSPDGDEKNMVRDELAVITIEEGDTGDVTFVLNE